MASLRARRVVVKTSLVRLRGRGLGAARAHLKYIQRDGVTREGNPGELYGPERGAGEGGDLGPDAKIDGRKFLARCSEDRHQFRFIVSAEDGDRYEDLKPLVRRLMGEVEKDLGTRLDWVAVDHHNTGHPHTHIVLRGVDDAGKDLVIAREYISSGLRERAIELVTRDLGPRLDHEIEARLSSEVDQERLTSLDRRLLARMDDERCVTARSNDPVFHAAETGRLRTLERMELAELVGQGTWRLRDGMEGTLRSMGERGDIIRLMQREMTRVRLEREQQIHTPDKGVLVGRVVSRGLDDEHRDRHYLIVDGTDGRSHYLDIGAGSGVAELPRGALVRAVPTIAQIRDIDRTIVAVATANGGVYSQDLHLGHDRTASRAYAQTHERRLEAMRRAGMAGPRALDGRWVIAGDHLKKVEAYEARLVCDRPVSVEVLAAQPLSALARADGATWLDRELTSATIDAPRDGGFGRELRGAFASRRQWLVAQGLATDGRDGFQLKRNALALLQRRELLRVAAGLSEELGKDFVEARLGTRIEGRIARRIEGISGSFALVEKSREFTLVPWRSVLDRQIGKQGGGLMREAGINWQFGKGRQGPEIA
ncbi:type IV secretory pathway VirD2 relaxase [Novosphingobium gossypii]